MKAFWNTGYWMKPDTDLKSLAKRTCCRALVAVTVYAYFLVVATLTWIYLIAFPIRFARPRLWWDILDTIYATIDRCILTTTLFISGIKVVFYGDFRDVRDKKENVIFICNHQSELDIVVTACAIEKTANYGRQRYVAKEPLLWLPFLGFLLYDRGCIFIERGNTNWRNFYANCRRLKRAEVPTTFVMYPEGTVMNWAIDQPNVWEKFRELARRNDREPFKHVLFPKHRGFYRMLEQFRDQVDAIYDVTIMYSATRGSGGEHLKAPCLSNYFHALNSTAHIHLSRFDINDVPEDEEGVKQFLIDRFTIKEKYLDTFYKTGAVPGEGEELRVQEVYYSVLCVLALAVSFAIGVSPLAFVVIPFYAIPSLVIAYTLGIFFVIIPERRSLITNPFTHEANMAIVSQNKEEPPSGSSSNGRSSPESFCLITHEDTED